MKLYEIEVARLHNKLNNEIKKLEKLCPANGLELIKLDKSIWVTRIENNQLVVSKSINTCVAQYQDCLQIYVLNQQLEKVDFIKNYMKSNVKELAA